MEHTGMEHTEMEHTESLLSVLKLLKSVLTPFGFLSLVAKSFLSEGQERRKLPRHENVDLRVEKLHVCVKRRLASFKSV